jgi:hypothetical protein
MDDAGARAWGGRPSRTPSPPTTRVRDTVGDLGMDVAGAALGAIALWLTGCAATAFDR